MFCVIAALVAAVFMSGGLPAVAQNQGAPEVVSPLGNKFYAQADEKGEIAEAEKKLAADPKNIDLIIALGAAQAKFWRYRDAINTYSRGLEIAPTDWRLYRHRGHRYISTRQFDKALADLEQGAKLNDKAYDVWYHLGLAYYLRGKFGKAAEAYERGRALADKDESLISISHWLYMSHRRDGKKAEAARVLEKITPELKPGENKSYFELLLFYKGMKKEADIFGLEKMADLDIATIGYGVANWRLYNGDKAKAKEYFEKIVSGKYWPAFGFIAAETELARK